MPTPGKVEIYKRVVIGSLALISLACVIAVIVPAGLSWDFGNFYDSGKIVAGGEFDLLLKKERNLIGGESSQGLMQFWGTPISAYLYVPLSWFSPETALVIFKIQNVAAYLGALLVLFLHFRHYVDDSHASQWRFAAAYALLALLYQPFWTVFRVGGQSTATVLLLLSLAFVAHGKLRFGWSSVLFVISVMIKPVLITALLFLMLLSRRRFSMFTSAYLLLFAMLSVALTGWDTQFEFLQKMLAGLSFESPWFYNSSIYTLPDTIEAMMQGAVSNEFTSVFFGVLTVFLKLCVTASLMALYYVNIKTLPSDAARAHFGFLISILFYSLFTQVLWAHYLSFLFILIAFVLTAYPGFERNARYLIIALILCLPMQNLMLINLLRSWFSFDTPASMLPVVIVKTAPLWIMWLIVFLCRKDIFRVYAFREEKFANKQYRD